MIWSFFFYNVYKLCLFQVRKKVCISETHFVIDFNCRQQLSKSHAPFHLLILKVKTPAQQGLKIKVHGFFFSVTFELKHLQNSWFIPFSLISSSNLQVNDWVHIFWISWMFSFFSSTTCLLLLWKCDLIRLWFCFKAHWDASLTDTTAAPKCLR